MSKHEAVSNARTYEAITWYSTVTTVHADCSLIPRPSLASVYCKWSKKGAGEGLGTRLCRLQTMPFASTWEETWEETKFILWCLLDCEVTWPTFSPNEQCFDWQLTTFLSDTNITSLHSCSIYYCITYIDYVYIAPIELLLVQYKSPHNVVPKHHFL